MNKSSGPLLKYAVFLPSIFFLLAAVFFLMLSVPVAYMWLVLDEPFRAVGPAIVQTWGSATVCLMGAAAWLPVSVLMRRLL